MMADRARNPEGVTASTSADTPRILISPVSAGYHVRGLDADSLRPHDAGVVEEPDAT